MSTRYSLDEWAVWLDEYRQSGLSVKEFSELIEVSVGTFYNWKRKLKTQTEIRIDDAEPTGALIETPFSEVLLPNTLESTVEIRLPAGASVKLPNDTDALRPILQVLAEIGAKS